MKYFLLFLTFSTNLILVAQIRFSDCFEDTKYDNNAVASFKDKLTLTVNVNTITTGNRITPLTFKHSESFKNESSLVRITDSIAVKIAVARISIYGRKKYLHQLVLLKYDKCWKEITTFSWSEFKPGAVGSGYSVGKKGDEDYISIEGIFSLE